MNCKTIAGTLLLACAPGAAMAEMNYTGIELNFVTVDLGDIDIDGDGFELAGAYAMSDRYFLFGQYSDQDLDFGLDGEAFEVGAGFNHALRTDIDFVGTVSYVDSEIALGSLSIDDDGFALGAGVRARVARAFEVEGGIRYLDLDESGSDTGFVVGGRYYLNEMFALSAGTDLSDNNDTFRIGFRAEF